MPTASWPRGLYPKRWEDPDQGGWKHSSHEAREPGLASDQLLQRQETERAAETAKRREGEHGSTSYGLPPHRERGTREEVTSPSRSENLSGPTGAVTPEVRQHAPGGGWVGAGARLPLSAERAPPPSEGSLLSSALTCLVSTPPTPSTALSKP